ncbi:5-hydroxytryptamine receptor 1B-like [Stegodyphus dumicola]|uniref:5-hydroxytryptamine receptor 1B-like n=1 Tax=Stegodyphus dumicola TaxID=202533 RepID=UPI0015B03325|nr:5-hydroxytryptamine receptor 1B-like [Stegodyphus dumicola]
MFIMSLAIADLTVGLVVMPISSIYVLTGRWRFGLVVCQFWLSADYSASTASILNLLVLSLDRYWSISRPLEYLRRRSKRRALIVITIVWLGSFMWIVPIIGWHAFFEGGKRKQPADVCETEFADNVVFKLTTSTLNFYCPMLAMIATYARIYMQIRKRARSEVMGRCSDIRPDSYSGNSDPQPLRYALATQTSKSKSKKKKKPNGSPAESIVLGPREDYPSPGTTPCEGSCDGYGAVALPTGARWRCNVCGATQTQKDEWTWPPTPVDDSKSPQKSNSDDEYPGTLNAERNSKKKKKSQSSKRNRKSGKPQASPTLEVTDMHLRVPQSSDLPPPSRSSSFRILCGATRAVLRRPSRRSMLSLRQETKAARQLGVIIGAFVLCWLPYMVLFVVTAACNNCLEPGVHTAAIWLGYLNSTVNPMIYALCNASFKRAFWKIGARFSAGWTTKCRRRNNNHASENNPFA